MWGSEAWVPTLYLLTQSCSLPASGASVEAGGKMSGGNQARIRLPSPGLGHQRCTPGLSLPSLSPSPQAPVGLLPAALEMPLGRRWPR